MRSSLMYHPLNKVTVDAYLAPAKAYEVNLALEHLKHTQAKDLLLFDRNYSSYIFLASLVKLSFEAEVFAPQKLLPRKQFTGRCSKSLFKAAQQLFKQYVIYSKTATLTANGDVKKQCKALGLPETITVRFVKKKLSTGETEVLITSLLDGEKYTTQMFQRQKFSR